MFFKHFGVNVSKSHQQFTHCTQPQHLPWVLANHLASAGKPLGLSPKVLRCPLPQASAGGCPELCAALDPHLLPLQEHQGRASGRRGSGSTDMLEDRAGGGKNRLRKRRQLNQADSFRSLVLPGRKGLLCGERGGRASRPPAPGPRRRLWRQRQQLGRPRAPAPAKGASVALNAPFHHSSEGCWQERG